MLGVRERVDAVVSIDEADPDGIFVDAIPLRTERLARVVGDESRIDTFEDIAVLVDKKVVAQLALAENLKGSLDGRLDGGVKNDRIDDCGALTLTAFKRWVKFCSGHVLSGLR